MSIEARYLYAAHKTNENNIGYDTSNILGDKYTVKIPYSLGLEKMYEINKDEFRIDDYGKIYSDMIINVTFKGAAKKEKILKPTKKGEHIESKAKYIIKSYGKGKKETATLNKVPRLEVELNTEKLRKHMYGEGFILNGIEYTYFMRSTSKSRGGNMLFIKKQYFNELLIEWARMGIVFSENQTIDVAGVKSYESLVLSGICGKLEISPEEILLINDYESIFENKASVTRLNEKNRLTVQDEEVEYHNNIWDGMSLLDSSKYNEFIEFEEFAQEKSLNGKTFVLLRNLWFKSAAFNFNIQKYFSDNNVTIEDVKKHGWTIAEDITQIKLITTPNSLKILKIKDCINNKYKDEADGQLRSMFEYWLQFINKNAYFGVVKAEHGIYDHARRCNQQILMALPLSRQDIRALLKCGEFPYMYDLRNDDDMFLMHLGNRKNSDNTMMYELACYMPKITRTDLFTNFKNDTLNDYKENWKSDGIKIPDSDFCVCVSNPMEMIQYASGREPEEWIRVHKNREAYCKFYSDGQELLAARNPCVCSGNIICLNNKKSKLLDDYMTLSDNVVVVNSIDSDIMERASGMDYDSDQLWLSSNEILVKKAKYCEAHYLTPVNKVERQTIKKYNKISDLSSTDTKIAKGKIGDIVNMGQILQAYYWQIFFNTTPPKSEEEANRRKHALSTLYNKISMLSNASSIEIDSAKREYKMETEKELSELRKLGMLENDDYFLSDFMDYGKILGARKKTITEKELKEIPDILEAFNNIENFKILEDSRKLTDEEKKQKNECYRKISDFLIYKHKKDDSKVIEKIRKPLYFKYAFPKSVENSLFFEFGMNCPMDNLCTLVDDRKETPTKETKEKKINIKELMNHYEIRGNDKHKPRIKEIAENYSKFCAARKVNNRQDDTVLRITKKEYFEQCVKEIKEIKLTNATIADIINACYGSKQAKAHNKDLSRIKKYMIDLIYAAHREKVLECFKGTVVFGRKCFKKMYLSPYDDEQSA